MLYVFFGLSCAVFLSVCGSGEGNANIRLRVGSNDVLAIVSPNYLAKPIFLTVLTRDVLVYGQLKFGDYILSRIT